MPPAGTAGGYRREDHVHDACAPGLEGIERSSHLIILYWLDRAERGQLYAKPPGESRERGLSTARQPGQTLSVSGLST